MSMNSAPARVLIVGDLFIPAEAFRAALAPMVDEGLCVVDSIDLPGTKEEQHAAQQQTEFHGANSVTAPPALIEAIAGADVVCLHFAPIPKAVIEAGSGLKLIAVARAGLENVDLEAATAAGIGVTPALGRNADAVAELQLGLLLSECRNIARADASIKAGGWRKEFPGARVELGGRTVGLVGFGYVAKSFVRKISGFGCRVVVFDPYTSDETLAECGVERAGALDDVFRLGDFVAVQARLTPETERFVGAAQFALMKPTAYFLNTSRSRLVDNDALLDVLQEGRIAGAGLDVYDAEPLAPDSPWRALDNVTLSTHFGGDTVDTNRHSAELVAASVEELLRKGRVAAAANATELGWR